MNSCGEIGCGCVDFVPNMFHNSICKECYHVLSKHHPASSKSTLNSSKICRASTFTKVAPPVHNKTRDSSPRKYPPVKTISEKFRKLSIEARPPELIPEPVNHKHESKEEKSPERNNEEPIKPIEIQEMKVVKEQPVPLLHIPLQPPQSVIDDNDATVKLGNRRKKPIRGFNDRHLFAVKRANTSLDISGDNAIKEERKIARREVSANFVNDSLKKVPKTILKEPPPSYLPPLPPDSPRAQGNIVIQDNFDSSSIIEKSSPSGTLQSNRKRHAIRHQPSSTFSTLFETRNSGDRNAQLDVLEKSIRLDPRKLQRNSKTIIGNSNLFKRRSSSDGTGSSLPVIKMDNRFKHKRRSSMPLDMKLHLIGIEIPPVILNILLYEPSREVRSIQVKIDESNNPTVAELLHQLSQELTSMKQSMETPVASSPTPSTNRSLQKKKTKTIFGRVGQFRRKKQAEESNAPSSPVSPRSELRRIKDFSLYWPAKDEWLEEDKEIANYCFPDNTTLEYKRRVRDFRLRVQYEIKLVFPQHGWTKTVNISPHQATVNSIRLQAVSWLKEEQLFEQLPNEQQDDSLILFGIYLNGVHLEEEDKVLSTYRIRQRDALEIKHNPGYSFEVSSNNTESSFHIHATASGTFNYLVTQLAQRENIDKNDLTVTLGSPLGKLESLAIGLSRALLKTGENFTISSNSGNSWIVTILRIPKDSLTSVESRVPPHIILEGEKVQNTITEHVTIFLPVKGQKQNVKYSGTLMITNYRILLERKFQAKDSGADWISVPLTSVSNIIKVKAKERELRKHCLDIFCKSVRKVTVGFVDSDQRNINFRILMDTISLHTLSALFAFVHATGDFGNELDVPFPGWDIYDAKVEYARMGIMNFNEERYGWRLTNINQNYEICKSYPKLIAVPATLSDELICSASKFRTKNRLPALVWLHPHTGVCLFRSSQPKVGLQRNTSKEDQKVLSEIREQGSDTMLSSKKTILHIFDARPMKAAVGNTVMGAGYESDATGYSFCRAHFLNIDNIHAVRESYVKLQNLCISSVEEDNETQPHWLEDLEATNWFYLLSRILVGARRIAELLTSESGQDPVLIHCSDGWDRTSQLSALSQLLVDPFYRTFNGFQILICKDWLSFGHQFAFRMGHNYGGKEEAEQQAPIFLQFLDCVFQLSCQFPTHFEFSSSLLAFLHDELINCKFGTFLMCCERERREANLSKKTRSIWHYIEEHREEFLNPFYEPTTKAVEYIAPNCDISNIQLWSAYYFKYLTLKEDPRYIVERKMKELQKKINILSRKSRE